MTNKPSKWIDLEDKVVIVTGGSAGIGAQIVKDLLNCGAKVAILDRNEPHDFVPNEKCVFLKVNITVKTEVEDAILKVKEKFSRIDALINNAGVTRPRILVDYFKKEPKYEIHEEDFYFMVDVNMKGTMFVSQAVTRIMIEQNSGVIVNVSSCAGIKGSQGHSIYAATKAAINSFTFSWSKELAKYNIRVIGVAPDILERTPSNNDEKYRAQAYGRGMDIDTPAEVFFQGYTKNIPFGRPGYLYEISNLINYLVSDYASYITGIIIPVSGGRTNY